MKRTYYFFGFAAFFAVWSCLSWSLGSRSFLLPSPLQVAFAIPPEVCSSQWQEAAWSTLCNLLLGACFGISFGIILGAGTALFPTFKHFLSPTLSALRPIPIGGWAPFAVLWFGTTHFAAQSVIVVGTFWTAFLITEQALNTIRPELYELAHIYGRRTKLQMFFAVGLPAASPAIFSGARTALGQGWSCLIAAELVGVPGLAQRMWESAGMAQTDIVMIQLISIGVFYVLCDRVFQYTINYNFPWIAHSYR